MAIFYEANRGAGAQRKRYRLCVRFPLKEIKYLIFSFLRSGVKAKRGTRQAVAPLNTQCLQNLVKRGERSVLTQNPCREAKFLLLFKATHNSERYTKVQKLKKRIATKNQIYLGVFTPI